MKKLIVILIIGTLVSVGFVGCGGQSGSDGDASGGETVVARRIQDGAKKLNQFQLRCPVCKGKPIKGEFHYDLQEGPQQGRVYFDKQECMKKFKQDPSKYLQGEFNPPK